MSPVVRPEPDGASEPAVDVAARPRLVEPWPPGVSREPTMRISDVLADLGGDFPALTPSKLRFLEEQGLVEPRRTAGGYRQYSRADLERLRFVLTQQRDRYLPLRVIREQLDALDAGETGQAPAPRLAAADGERATSPGPTGGRWTVAGLAEHVGTGEEVVTALLEAGILRRDAAGHLEPWSREALEVAVALAEHGVEPRHLRPLRSAVDKQVDMVGQIVAPLRGQRAVAAQAHAASVADELAELFSRLHTVLVRGGVSDLPL
ncbi:transcriptional regulator FtsR [Actinotalea fermentans]|uniref:MerR family transcriptional regulator n=1 Tax=Actinotalea fermentans TaxID=43671 RepID=A0A511YUP3_9CELL|nr:MerR family transcriptional regulator [Actinotalea fermentans]KGM17456.1 transcriptional regulator [Actinotalea fermentans ATCC 43279 = JCM 9966 = DSM 3133]GEN78915.1 MerR family transcriptional regulator [Actinotalea fermentans]